MVSLEYDDEADALDLRQIRRGLPLGALLLATVTAALVMIPMAFVDLYGDDAGLPSLAALSAAMIALGLIYAGLWVLFAVEVVMWRLLRDAAAYRAEGRDAEVDGRVRGVLEEGVVEFVALGEGGLPDRFLPGRYRFVREVYRLRDAEVVVSRTRGAPFREYTKVFIRPADRAGEAPFSEMVDGMRRV